MPDQISVVGGAGPTVTTPLVNHFVRPQAAADTTGAKVAQPQSEKNEATSNSNNEQSDDLLNKLNGSNQTEEQGKDYLGEDKLLALEKAVETLSQYLDKLPSEMEVRFDKETDRYLFKLVNPVTREIVKQYPPDEFLNMVRHLREMEKNSTNGGRGIILDDRH